MAKTDDKFNLLVLSQITCHLRYPSPVLSFPVESFHREPRCSVEGSHTTLQVRPGRPFSADTAFWHFWRTIRTKFHSCSSATSTDEKSDQSQQGTNAHGPEKDRMDQKVRETHLAASRP